MLWFGVGSCCVDQRAPRGGDVTLHGKLVQACIPVRGDVESVELRPVGRERGRHQAPAGVLLHDGDAEHRWVQPLAGRVDDPDLTALLGDVHPRVALAPQHVGRRLETRRDGGERDLHAGEVRRTARRRSGVTAAVGAGTVGTAASVEAESAVFGLFPHATASAKAGRTRTAIRAAPRRLRRLRVCPVAPQCCRSVLIVIPASACVHVVPRGPCRMPCAEAGWWRAPSSLRPPGSSLRNSPSGLRPGPGAR